MRKKPWDFWTPDVLSKAQTKVLCEQKYIINTSNLKKSVGYSSIDLHLLDEGYKMTQGSVKPSKANYLSEILHDNLAEKIKPVEELYTLQPKLTYLFKLQEHLNKTKDLSEANFYGMATAKSSIGRVDVLARLVVDGMDKYEYFDPKGLKEGNGEMFLEITPMTFPVIVKEGISLSQLRIFYGDPDISEIKDKSIFKSLLNDNDNDDGSLSVDLLEEPFGGIETSAFYTHDAIYYEDKDPINLWKLDDRKKPNPENYWQRIKKDDLNRITIEKDVFYILKSKEKISVPAGIAIYCKAIDETIGEMRIHYAGFVHPFFGKNNDKSEGTPLIFEVRGHNVRVSLKDGEKMAYLICYRLSENNPVPDEDPDEEDYTNQTLKLSNFFKEWGDKKDN